MDGKVFGKLTCIRSTERIHGKRAWECRCECGNTTRVPGSALRSGNTTSCGCIRHWHGRGGSRVYYSWTSMISRCEKPSTIGFENYGGRGLYVCPFLKESPNHLAELIGERLHGTTLDRRNNSGNYTCGKCSDCIAKKQQMNLQWATRKQQGRNRRSNVLITFQGRTQCMMEWAEELGIKYDAIRSRYRKGLRGDAIFESIKSITKQAA